MKYFVESGGLSLYITVFSPHCTLKLTFTTIRIKKMTHFLSPILFLGETVTWVSGRRLVGREQEPLIHPASSIFGQG